MARFNGDNDEDDDDLPSPGPVDSDDDMGSGGGSKPPAKGGAADGAHYRGAEVRCHGCDHFEDPNICKIGINGGTVDPEGGCDEFAPFDETGGAGSGMATAPPPPTGAPQGMTAPGAPPARRPMPGGGGY